MLHSKQSTPAGLVPVGVKVENVFEILTVITEASVVTLKILK
jgi:hypothetical protein